MSHADNRRTSGKPGFLHVGNGQAVGCGAGSTRTCKDPVGRTLYAEAVRGRGQLRADSSTHSSGGPSARLPPSSPSCGARFPPVDASSSSLLSSLPSSTSFSLPPPPLLPPSPYPYLCAQAPRAVRLSPAQTVCVSCHEMSVFVLVGFNVDRRGCEEVVVLPTARPSDCTAPTRVPHGTAGTGAHDGRGRPPAPDQPT